MNSERELKVVSQKWTLKFPFSIKELKNQGNLIKNFKRKWVISWRLSLRIWLTI